MEFRAYYPSGMANVPLGPEEKPYQVSVISSWGFVLKVIGDDRALVPRLHCFSSSGKYSSPIVSPESAFDTYATQIHIRFSVHHRELCPVGYILRKFLSWILVSSGDAQM